MKKFLIITLLLILYFIISAYSYTQIINSNLSNSILRLHIVANSNSLQDQHLKYLVRNNVINYINNLCKNSPSKEDSLKILSNNLNQISEIANKTISENGFSYSSTSEIGNFKFPTKNYANISIPAGYYDALEIRLGNSSGQNWWCVLYPSLCFYDENKAEFSIYSKEYLENSLIPESFNIISNKNNSLDLNFKFKIIELINTSFTS